MKTMVIPPMEKSVVERLRKAAPGVTFEMASDESDLLRLAPTANAIHGFNSEPFFRAAPALEWAQSSSAGVESYPFDLFRERGIAFTNAKQIYGIQLADHTLALILAFSRQLPFLFRAQAERRWESRDNFPPGELDGQRLLVIGLGGTGIETARRAKSFGMHVTATRRSHELPVPVFVDSVHPHDALHVLLPDADWVAVCVPRTPDTIDLIADRELELMKRSAYIVCVTRGAIINTESLTRALEAGEIAGAGLDVTDPEPLPADHPLWAMDNVIITPHASGHSPGAHARMIELLVENVSRWAKGEELINRVDLTLEY